MTDGRQHSFVMFDDAWPALSILTDEQRGRLIQALYAHHGFCEPVELDQATKAVLAALLPRMTANWKRYEESRDRRAAAAKKRWEQRHGGESDAMQCNAMHSNAEQCRATQSNAVQSSAKQCDAMPARHDVGFGFGSGVGSGVGVVVPSELEAPSGQESTPPYPPQGGSVCAEEPPAEVEANREEPAPEKKPRKRKTPDLRPDDFEALWEKYPRKDAKERARKAWDHLARAGELADQFTLMAALTWRCSYWKEQQTPNNYIPQCSTWIGEKRWNDPQPKSPPPRQPTWPRRQSLLSPEERAIEESRVSLENVVRRMERGGDGG